MQYRLPWQEKQTAKLERGTGLLARKLPLVKTSSWFLYHMLMCMEGGYAAISYNSSGAEHGRYGLPCEEILDITLQTEAIKHFAHCDFASDV